MSIKVVRGLRFPESSCLGLRFSNTHLNCEEAPYSRANEFKCQGDHKWQLKCLPASLAQLEKELYNSPLSLEEKMILHMLSSIKHSSGLYRRVCIRNERSNCCTMSRKVAKIIVHYVFFRGFWANFNRTFLKLRSNGVHFKKRRSQNVKNTTLDMQLKP